MSEKFSKEAFSRNMQKAIKAQADKEIKSIVRAIQLGAWEDIDIYDEKDIAGHMLVHEEYGKMEKQIKKGVYTKYGITDDTQTVDNGK